MMIRRCAARKMLRLWRGSDMSCLDVRIILGARLDHGLQHLRGRGRLARVQASRQPLRRRLLHRAVLRRHRCQALDSNGHVCTALTMFASA